MPAKFLWKLLPVAAGLTCLISCAYEVTLGGSSPSSPANQPKTVRSVESACQRQGKEIRCILSGTYTGNHTLSAGKTWILRGVVHIGEDKNIMENPSQPNQPGRLVIEAGATILGEKASNGALVIHRSSQIEAKGTAQQPIVFTSSQPKEQRKPGDWGGLYISGLATICDCGTGAKFCQSISPYGFYGGTNDQDNSGTLKYVRIEFAGRPRTDVSENNGLVLQGVGNQTQISHVQIHRSQQTGLTLLGGTVNWRYILSTGAEVSQMHWRFGWRGLGQFFLGQGAKGSRSTGIDGQNNPGLRNEPPRSQPTLSNLTLLSSGLQSKRGLHLSEGTAANLANLVIQGWKQSCIAISQFDTFVHAWAQGKLSGTLTLSHSILSCPKSTEEPEASPEETPPFSVDDFVFQLNQGNQRIDPALQGWTPKPNSAALKNAAFLGPHQHPFFQRVPFKGAVGLKDWTQGWTTPGTGK